MGTVWGHCGPTGHPLQPKGTPRSQTCSTRLGMGDRAHSGAWGQQPLPQPGELRGSWGQGGHMGTLGSPEDSGSAPGRLCRHGHAPTPAPLPPSLHGSQGGSATRPQREGAQPPQDQPQGAQPASGWAVPVETRPPPHAMCHVPRARPRRVPAAPRPGRGAPTPRPWPVGGQWEGGRGAFTIPGWLFI